MAEFKLNELLAMAIRNLRHFNYVGFVETFEEDAAEIFRQLSQMRPKVRCSNVSIAARRLTTFLTTQSISLATSLNSIGFCTGMHGFIDAIVVRR